MFPVLLPQFSSQSQDEYVEIHESRIQSGKEHNFDISSKGVGVNKSWCQVGEIYEICEIAAILELQPRNFVWKSALFLEDLDN